MDYDRSKYKVKNWKNFTYLHWIINPGLAFNELVLGQRISKVMLIDKTSDRPLMERTYIPCPHCHTLHDGRIWSKKRAFKNWFGHYCPECGKIIPCLHNGLAFLLLALTYPVWGWFKDDLKAKWLKAQPDRYKQVNINNSFNKYNNVSWLKMGIKFGAFMFIFMSLFYLLQKPGDYLQILFVVLPATAIGGLLFGYLMKLWMGRRGNNKQHQADNL